MSRWNDNAIEYTDEERLREVLVGRTIVARDETGEGWNKVITFILDDGTRLRAHATDGGCGCTNGCFSVNSEVSTAGTIMNVEIEEVASRYYDGKEEKVEPGSISDGSARIRLFIYDELGKHTLVESEGGDNGYYGWGYYLTVDGIKEAAF